MSAMPIVASVVVLHAWQVPQTDISRVGMAPAGPAADVFQMEAARELEGVLIGWREKYPGVPVSQDVVRGHAGRALVGLSARADLVVLGRHPAHHGPGTVIHAVLNHAHGPVVTVPTVAGP
ncbi:MAG: universal stress protein [Streptosporangiaceae bacterium]